VFSLKKSKRSKKKEKDIKEAKKVVVSPAAESLAIYSYEIIRKSLIGKTIKKGDIVSIDMFGDTQTTNNSDDTFFSFKIPLKIIDTIPKGKVKVTEDTILEILEFLPDEFGLPQNKVIKVKTKPNLKGMYEVENLKELLKLSEKYFIKKYEDDKKVIYFVEDYYLILQK